MGVGFKVWGLGAQALINKSMSCLHGPWGLLGCRFLFAAEGDVGA